MTAADLVPDSGPDGLRRLPLESTVAALDAVRDGLADYACVPIENSIDGSVMPTLDSLAIGSALQVFAETTLDVAFSIAVKPGRTADDVRTLAAFPVAAAQVRQWLAANLPGAELRPAYSNADAARQVAEGQADAAVTSPLAASHWGLAALADGDRRRAQRPYPLRSGRVAGSAAGPHRCRSHVGGAAHRQCAGRAAGRAGRIRHPRHRPDQDRIQADPHRTRHLPVLRRLPRPYRRRRSRRGAQGAAPSLRGRALPGFLADRAGRRRGAAPGGRRVALAGASCAGRGSSAHEWSLGVAATRPVPGQRRTQARHQATGGGVDSIGPRSGARVCPYSPRFRAAGVARALGGHPGVADGRGDRRRTRPARLRGCRHSRSTGRRAGKPQRR